jgi:sporulation protein YlmC with PRC-barrel domain
MRKILLTTAVAGTALLSAPAFAEECAQALRDYNETVMSEEGYRQSIAPGQQADLRQLRDAALILSNAGQDEACNEVVAAIKDIAEQSREAAEQPADAEEWQSRQVERLKTAKSLDEMTGQLRAEEIIGSDVRNMENSELGEIEDILLATKEGDSSYATVSHGGFIGLGEKQIAVPMKQLMVTEDKDTYILNVSEETLENAPSFERGEFDAISDEKWRRANDEYFSN